jgi:transglutaminase-like putative cysteine protease
MRHLIPLALLLASPVLAAEALGPEAVGPRTVRFTYEARLVPPAGAHEVELWLPLPREDGQAVREMTLAGSSRATVVPLSAAGDRAAYLRVTDPAGPVTLRLTATIARHELGSPVSVSHATSGDVDRTLYASELAPTPAIVVSDEVRTIARRETAGRRTVVAQARALYDWVFDHMQYDKSVPGWGLGDIPYCLRVGKGNCTDFHTLFIALARAADIPARWNIGFPLAYGGTPGGAEQDVAGYHCWAEFYAPGAGWVPVDISEARKHPELKDYFFGHLSGNRVLFTRGRDLVLDGGKRLNYFIYPVGRVDGQDVPKVDWTFHYSDVAEALRTARAR